MTTRRSFLLAAAGAALAGCAAGPDYRAPAGPDAKGYTRGDIRLSEGLSLKPGAAVDAQWWQAYDSPAINALVQQALDHNPTIAAALANLKVAQQNVAAQRGFFYPTVGAGYNFTRQNVGNTLSSQLNSGETIYNLHTAALNVGYTPDVFGLNRRQVESLKAQEDVQRYQLAAARITVASNVVTAALQEAALAEQVTLTEKAVAAARAQLEHIQRMQSQGYSSQLDVAAAESALAQAQQQLPPLSKQLEQTRDLLAVLCGELPERGYAPATLDAVKLPAELPTGVPSELVRQRPDVRAAEAQVHAANAEVGVATANLLPQFMITASIGGAATTFAQMFAGGNGIWALGGAVSQTLFAGGTLTARKRAAEAALEATLAQYKSTALTAFQNVADTLYALQADGASYEAARNAEAAAQKLLDNTQKAFDAGYTAAPPLLLAQQQAAQARAARLQAYGGYLADSAALYQSLGGGWVDEAGGRQNAAAAAQPAR